MDRGHSPKTTDRRSPRHPGLSWQKACRWEIAQRSPGGGGGAQMVYPDGLSVSHEGARERPLQMEGSSGRSLLSAPVVRVPYC